MLSASTRRFAPVPVATTLLVAAGLAGGVLALGVTENLPGQSSRAVSEQSVRTAPAILAPSAGEGLVGPGRIGEVHGLGATVGTPLPMIKGIPSYGQGEGLIGPDAHVSQSTIEGTAPNRSDAIDGFQSTTGSTDEASSVDTYVFDPYVGGITDESSP